MQIDQLMVTYIYVSTKNPFLLITKNKQIRNHFNLANHQIVFNAGSVDLLVNETQIIDSNAL